MIEYQFILSYNGNDLTLPDNEQPKDFTGVNSVIKRDLETHGLFFKFTSSDLLLKFTGSGRDFLNDAWLNEGLDAQVTLTINRRQDEYSSWVQAYQGTAIMRNRIYNLDYFEVDFAEFNILSKIQARKKIPYNTSKSTNLDGGVITNNLTTFDYNSKILKLQSSFGVASGLQFTLQKINSNVDTGTTTNAGAFKLIDTGASFLSSAAVMVGSRVSNSTDSTESIVLEVNSDTVLTLADDIFDASELYSIYSNFETDNSFVPAGTEAFNEGLDEIEYPNGDKGLLDGEPEFDDGSKLTPVYDGTNSLLAWLFESGFSFQRIPSVEEYSVEIEVNVRFDVLSDEPARYCLVEYEVDRLGNESISQIHLGSYVTSGDGIVEQSDTYTITVTRRNSKKIIFGFTTDVDPSGAETTTVLGYPITTQPNEIDENICIYLKATWLSQYPDTTIEGQSVFNAINKNLEYITGEQNLLTSNLLDTGGILENLYESNGRLIRGYSEGIVADLQKRLDSINAIFGIGHGYQKSDYNTDDYEYRVEVPEYFYADEEMVDVGEVAQDSFTEEYNEFFNFNEIQVGYKDYPAGEDLPNSINDFCNVYKYFLPFETLIGGQEGFTRRAYISEYIASDFLWEITRRKQFTNEASKSWKYDNDLFVLLLGYDNSQLRDSVENVSGDGYDDNQVVITSFNWLLNPKYNLYNHSRVINSIFYTKPLSSLITLTSTELNNDIDFNQTEVTQIGDDSGVTRSLEDNILISDFNSGVRLFDPITYKFKTALSQTQLDTIIEGHRNGLSSANYGYITFTDPEGNSKQGYLLNLSYNIVDEIGSFELIKKAEAYTI